MLEALILGTLAGLATAVGALVVILFGKPSTQILSLMLGFAAGVMLAIATLELLPEAIEFGGIYMALGGFLMGVAFLYLLDLYIPHFHIGGNCTKQEQQMLRVGYLIFLGIAVHNLAEGLAIGAGLLVSHGLGLSIAIALALHNIPEGIAMAVPLKMGGMGRWKMLGLMLVAGLMTAVGAVFGDLVFSLAPSLVGGALGLAAGAMFYIVGDELIPQARCYHHHHANIGLVAGFVLGMFL